MAGSRPQQRLNALPDGHLGQAAALAAAFEPDSDPAIRRAVYGHMAAVYGDRRVDLGVQDVAGRLREIPAALGR